MRDEDHCLAEAISALAQTSKAQFESLILWQKGNMNPTETCSAYRILGEGETIRESDEFLDDGGVWRKTVCAGQEAPNPAYTSHRQYRRRVGAPSAEHFQAQGATSVV